MFGISSGIIIALIVISSFLLIFGIIDYLGILKPYGFELSGPFLMWKTKRGKKLIDRIAKKRRFWKNYGNLAIVVLSIAMVIIFLLMIYSAYLATSVPAESAPDPEMVLGIPGINPLIPIWYGIAGLAVAIIIHEFSHGILSRVADIKVKSLGLVFLVVPIGAFVEPDEDEMDALPKIKRDRIYGVGPTTNILFGIVCVLIFTSIFMASVSPKQDGLIVNGMLEESPAERAGIDNGEAIVSIAGKSVKNNEELDGIILDPLQEVEVETLSGEDDTTNTRNVVTGLVISGITEGYPADENDLKEGDILYSFDNQMVKNRDDFDDILGDKKAGDELNITVYRWKDGGYNQKISKTIVLADKYQAYSELYPTINKEEFKGQGFIGIGVYYLGISTIEIEMISDRLAHPYRGDNTVGEIIDSSLEYIALPFLQFSPPLPEDITGLYEINGPLSILPENSFWIISNTLYWLFWLNLMVGLFNALPAVPLDGGYVFKDGLRYIVEKFNVKERTEERITSAITYGIAFLILGMLLWQLIGPRI